MILRRSLILVFLLFAADAFAQNAPNLPFIDRGACPFECCTYRTWTARKNTVLRKEMRAASPVAFRIKSGESVEGLTGVVVTSKAGIVEALRDTKVDAQDVNNFTLNIKRGGRLYLLTYLGEGVYKIWYRGKIYQANISGDEDFKTVSEPESVWWVKIKNKKGRVGWTNLSGNFDNQDSCG